jgi:recombination protein RecA
MDIKEKKAKLDKILKKLTSKDEGVSIDYGNIRDQEFMATPFSTVNELLGGGFPKGKYSVIAGPSQTGKGALLLQCIAYQQSLDPNFVALWTDAEDALDKLWCKRLGVDLNRLIVQRPSEVTEFAHMERLLEDGLTIAKSGTIDAWIIDSLGALIPKAELDKDIVEGTMNDMQRKLGVFFRKSISTIGSKKVVCVLIGQVYTDTSSPAGLEAVRGGNAAKHWAHIRLKTRRGRKDLFNETADVVMADGNTKKISLGWPQVLKLDKTRVNPYESREVILKFYYGRGFDSVDCAIGALIGNDVFERRGGWYYHESLPDGKLQGKDKLVLFLKDEQNKDLLASLVDELQQNNAVDQVDHILEDSSVDDS